jgi:methylthioribose-1-phosphate isomerase
MSTWFQILGVETHSFFFQMCKVIAAILRASEEVTHIRGIRIAPDVDAANPAFDVTPARLIAAIITECGVARAPF